MCLLSRDTILISATLPLSHSADAKISILSPDMISHCYFQPRTESCACHSLTERFKHGNKYLKKFLSIPIVAINEIADILFK